MCDISGQKSDAEENLKRENCETKGIRAAKIAMMSNDGK
jgi:hypothetical protein